MPEFFILPMGSVVCLSLFLYFFFFLKGAIPDGLLPGMHRVHRVTPNRASEAMQWLAVELSTLNMILHI